IQIVDPDMEFPTPARNFACVKQYKFLDLEEDGPSVETLGIQPSQAADIADDLKRALLIGGNVVVHCHAGVCRSGAVAEAGVVLGFRDLHVYRQPNSFVKKLLRLCLGLKYSFEK
ncbi:MAG TPA: hypothetical protein VFM18_11000, partial [Methanosarcina sp.]|nr:hypothetical protein [Methanosarcina sp.]